jgi:hypothetical protein
VVTIQGEEGFMRFAKAEGWLPRGEAIINRAERLADACAIAWSG